MSAFERQRPSTATATATDPAGPTRRRTLGMAAAVGATAAAGSGFPASAVAAASRGPRRDASRFVYIGGYGGGDGKSVGLSVFRRRPGGGLELAHEVPEVPNPSWLTTHPTLPVLYAISEVDTWNGKEGGGVTAYAMDDKTGALTRINDVRISSGPAHGAVVADGQYLMTANYGSENFTVAALRPDGGLDRVTDVFEVAGCGPNPDSQVGPHPHEVVVAPDGQYVLGTDLGTDQVWVWQLDSAAGTLAPAEIPTAQVASGSGARHLAFGIDGTHAYVINELTSSVTAFTYDAERGTFTWLQTISSLPPGFEGESFGAEIAVHPSGRYAYVTNRGHNSIVTFRIEQRTGLLAPAGWTPTGGDWPRHFALDPAGERLLVANQNSGSVTEFRIGRHGRPTSTGVRVEVEGPACVLHG